MRVTCQAKNTGKIAELSPEFRNMFAYNVRAIDVTTF